MGGRKCQISPQGAETSLRSWCLGDKLGPVLDSLDWALNPQPPILGAQILTHYTLTYSSSGD